jgi:ferredoxin-NADP reductase
MEITFLGKKHLATDIYSFYFHRPKGFIFEPGDYTELALNYGETGGRHWFSIASSPKENSLMFVTRLPRLASDYKKAMAKLQPNEKVQVSPPIGTFNLPFVQNPPLLFVAAGIGITPFLSMFKFIQATNGQYSILLLYAAKNQPEFIFQEMIEKTPNLETMYVLTKPDKNWNKLIHPLNLKLIKDTVPGYKHKKIYLSGAQNIIEKLYYDFLKDGLNKENLMLDYFEGYNDL